MADKELDELFRRFVREHDVRAVGELFDVAAPQLARIAWHLTHDASGVEDLVQATFLTALASTQEFATERRVMPWLLRILLNHARNARRAVERKPETLAVDVVDPRTPESDLERRELHEVVERAVAELPDTYRDVVATWLIEGATPTEIAHRTGKPAATVRVQLRRGLELLRSGLPAGVAGLLATNGWSASSFAASREVVVAQAARVARTLAPTSAVVAGGMLVASKWLLAGAAALVTAAGVGWLVHNNTVQPTTVASAPVVSANDLHVPNQVAAVDAPTAERDEVTSAQPAAAEAAKSPAPGWWLICDVSGVLPSATAQLTSPFLEGWSANVEGQRFEVDISPFFGESGFSSPTSFVVRYDSPGLANRNAPGFMPTHVLVEVGKQVDLDTAFAAARVELHARFDPQPSTVEVIGRVVVPTDRQASDAVVALFGFDPGGRIEDKPSEFVRCAQDGSFRVRASSSGEHVLAAALPSMRPATRIIAGDWHVQIDVGEVVLEPGEHLAGVVAVDPTTGIRASAVTARLLGAQTLAFLDVRPRTGPWSWRSCDFAWIGSRFEWNWPTADPPPGGEFRIDGLAPLEYDLEVQPGFEGTASEQIEYLAELGRRDSVRLTPSLDHVVVPLRSLSTRLEIRADGQPLDEASVMLRSANGTDSGVNLAGHLVKVLWSGTSSATVRVSKEGFAPTEITLEPHESTGASPRLVELSRDASLASLVLRPVLQCANDKGMYYDVTLDALSDSSGEFFAQKSFSLRNVEWRFDGVVPGRYLVVVDGSNSLLSGLSWCLEPRPEIEVAAGESAIRDLVFQAGGRLSFTVRDQKAATATVRVRGVDSGFCWGFFDPRDGVRKLLTGYEVSAPIGARVTGAAVLEPGALNVTVTLNGARATKRERTVNIVVGQTTELVVDFSKPDEQ